MPDFLKKYFWDVDFRQLSLAKNSSFIAARLLEYGDEQAIRWLFKNIENSIIRETVITSRSLSNKSLLFWSSIFNIDKRKIPWLKKSYQKMQERHWLH